jgi:DNA polymerase I-like protein with 3'-5' exonuclease and polymerase domains
MMLCDKCELHIGILALNGVQCIKELKLLTSDTCNHNSDWCILLLDTSVPLNPTTYNDGIRSILKELDPDVYSIPVYLYRALNCTYPKGATIKKKWIDTCSTWVHKILKHLNLLHKNVVIVAMGEMAHVSLEKISNNTKGLFLGSVPKLATKHLKLRFIYKHKGNNIGSWHRVFTSYPIPTMITLPSTKEIGMKGIEKAIKLVKDAGKEEKKSFPWKQERVNTNDELKNLMQSIRKEVETRGTVISSLDIETNNTLFGYRDDAEILTFSIAFEKEGVLTAYCLPINHKGVASSKLGEANLMFLKWFARQKSIIKVTHHGLFDVLFCKFQGVIEWNSWHYDTFVLASLVGIPEGYRSLKYLAERFLGFGDWTANITVDEGKKDYVETSWTDISTYNNNDALATYALHIKLLEYLENLASQKVNTKLKLGLYNGMIRDTMTTLAELSYSGIGINPKIRSDYEKHFQDYIDKLDGEVRADPTVREYEELFLNDDYNLWESDYEAWCNTPNPKGGEYADGTPKVNSTRRSEPSYTELSVTSPKQLAIFAVDFIGLPVIKRTTKGMVSVDAEVMNEYALRNSVFGSILKRRKVHKELSTYITPLIDYTFKGDNRVHSKFNMGFAISGRLSSDSPNLQNIKSRGHAVEGYKVKDIYEVGEGRVLLSYDFSQAELRVLCSNADDKNMIGMYKRGEDSHTGTGALLFGIDYKDVDKDQRFIGKQTNFGIVYQMGFAALAGVFFECLLGKFEDVEASDEEKIQMAVSEAISILENLKKSTPTPRIWYPKYNRILNDAFYELSHYVLASHKNKFKGIWAFVDRMKEFVAEHGYSYGPTGRTCWVPDVRSTNHKIASEAMRTAVNACTQGPAADITCDRMNALMYHIKQSNRDRIICNTVHDAVMLDCLIDDNLIDDVMKYHQIMCDCSGWKFLQVDMEVDLEVGKSWGSMEEVNLDSKSIGDKFGQINK